MVYKILKDRRMKVGLQNTIGTVHGTVSPDVKYFITAACIHPGAGTILDECTFVPG
jgi:hypothetical protein